MDQWNLATILNSYDIIYIDIPQVSNHKFPNVLCQQHAPASPSASWWMTEQASSDGGTVCWLALDTAKDRASPKCASRNRDLRPNVLEEHWIEPEEAGVVPAEPSVC